MAGLSQFKGYKMNELIKIRKSDVGKETVDARELHRFLESKQEFSKWIKDRIEKYDFVQGADFIKFDKLVNSDSKPRTEYALLLDMAKELSMVERSEKGKQARQYFIDRDKKLSQIESKQLPTTYKEALLELIVKVEENEKLELKLKEAQPKIEFVNHIEASEDSITVAEFAKLIYKKGLEIGQRRLFTYLYNLNYLRNRSEPYQKWMDMGLFEIKKTSYTKKGDKSKKTDHKVMITGKGQTHLTAKIRASFQIKEKVNSQTEF